MDFISLAPFVPSGSDHKKSKQLFIALGFKVAWDAGDYTGFENGNCKFILQSFDNKEFAENFMVNVKISNANEFWQELNDKNLSKEFGIRISKPVRQPYGLEVNVIDLAGVCWHFVE
jgi:hypothetical protein